MNASSAGSAAFQVPRHPDVLQCALGLCLQAPRKGQRLRSARGEENSAKDQRILTLEERLMQYPLIASVWHHFPERSGRASRQGIPPLDGPTLGWVVFILHAGNLGSHMAREVPT
jgi:hypothetical protein